MFTTLIDKHIRLEVLGNYPRSRGETLLCVA